MPLLGTWLVSLIGPMVREALISLGIGLVTYVGMSEALNTMLSQAKAAFIGIPPVYLNLMAIGGIPEGLGIISGAMVARVAYTQTKKFKLKK